MDLGISALVLVLVAPVMIGIALAIRLRMGWPVLFRQERPGRHGEPFELIKFRTMTTARGPEGTPMPDDERITRLGRLLRRLSLDELPELVNVLKGEMSLVGPRPLLVEYLPLYTAEQARRHEVRPGITGWAQVHGRRHLPMAERFVLDVWYVDHHTLALDLHILLLTVRRVLGRAGVEPRPDEQVDPFQLQGPVNDPSSRNDQR